MLFGFLAFALYIDGKTAKAALLRPSRFRHGLVPVAAATAAATTTVAAAATAAAAATTAVAAPATAAAAATTTGAVFLRLGFVDREGAAVALLAVERRDGRLGLRIAAHLDEPEALAPARV